MKLAETKRPWEKWIPGVLSKHQIIELRDKGLITGMGPDKTIDHSSFDLSPSSEAYRMKKGAVKPSGAHPYSWFIEKNGLAEKFEPNPDGTFTLETKHTYVLKLREKLQRGLTDGGLYGQATAKSSVGRVDVLARLIVDGMDKYECFTPEGLKLQSGDLYLEVTPMTFNVKVKPGEYLSQLRLFYGKPEDVEIRSDELFQTILRGPGSKDGSLTVDLTPVKQGGLPVSAFRAIPRNASNQPVEPAPLWEATQKPDPCGYWAFETAQDDCRLEISPDNFFLLRSKERIWLPPGIAIYCRASDETIGEMRIHYAGFVHPFFGMNRKKDEAGGAPLIFEVRGHQVNVSLADGEKMANLSFYRMSSDCKEEPPIPGDTAAGPVKQKTIAAYEDQDLDLSKFFGSWPEKLERGEDGRVKPI